MCVVELSTNKFWRPLLYCAVGLSLVLPLSALKCEKTESTCTQLLEDEFWPDLDTCEQRYDDVLYNPVINYDINPGSDTFNLFISFNANTSLIDPDRIENDWKSFLIGYTGSGCHFGSDSSHNLCYDIQNRFPTDTDTDKHDVNDTTIQVGDQCTIFGCFLYANQTANECTEYVLKDFINETILFLRECSAPDYVEHGNITSNPSEGRYVEGDYFNITCEDGFVATYGGTSQCLISGNWSTGNPTSCIRKCEEIEDMSVEGGLVEKSTETLVAGSILTVTCLKYYTGGGNITCDENGTWSEPELPSCTPKQCPEIGKNIKGGKLDVSEPASSHGRKESHYLPNTNISLTCGWFYSGGGSITCGVNETWSAPLPHCVPDGLVISMVGAIFGLVLLILLFGVIIVCYRSYHSYRYDRIRQFNLIFKMQARTEALDPNYTPIDLRKSKEVPISLSIQAIDDQSGILEDYYPPISSQLYTLPKDAHLHIKAHSLNSLLEVPVTTGRRSMLDTGETTPKHRSCPVLQDSQFVSTDPANLPVKEALDHSVHFSDTSLNCASGNNAEQGTSCTAIRDSSSPTHPSGGSTDREKLVNNESSQDTPTNTSDNEVPETPPTTLAGNGPSNIGGPSRQSVLSENEVNNDNTPSDVTLAFAMVDPPQTTVLDGTTIANSVSLLEDLGSASFQSKSEYINCTEDQSCITQSTPGYMTELATGNVAESSTSCVAESGTGNMAESITDHLEKTMYVSEPGTGYIHELTIQKYNPDCLWSFTLSSSSSNSSSGPGQFHAMPCSEYISDMCGRSVTGTGFPPPGARTSESVAELPGSQQVPTDQRQHNSHYTPTNTLTPGYVILSDVDAFHDH